MGSVKLFGLSNLTHSPCFFSVGELLNFPPDQTWLGSQSRSHQSTLPLYFFIELFCIIMVKSLVLIDRANLQARLSAKNVSFRKRDTSKLELPTL